MKKEKKQKQRPFLLRAIYLREGKQWMSDSFDPMIPGQPLFAQTKSSGRSVAIQEAVENTPDAKAIKSCRFTSNFEFRYLNRQPDEKLKDEDDRQFLVAEISARITVDYLIGTDETPPKEMLDHWSASNALLHCWPYWREFCHSTLMRMHLPITMLPMLEINPKED
jgi:hypothetical protein